MPQLPDARRRDRRHVPLPDRQDLRPLPHPCELTERDAAGVSVICPLTTASSACEPTFDTLRHLTHTSQHVLYVC